MAYKPHIRLVVRGTFDNTPEEWTYSLKFRKVNAGNPDTETGDFDGFAVESAIVAFHANARFTSETRVTGWRAYDIGTDGRTQGNPRITEFTVAQQPKGTGTSRHPLQTSLCITTEAVNRGPARFGRFFLPGPSFTLNNDYRLTTAVADTWVADTVTYVKALSNAINIPSLPTLSIPMVNESAVGTGVEQQVDFIRVGLVPDTIRRRRNKLLEEHRSSGDIDW